MADGVSAAVGQAMLNTMVGTDANDVQLHTGPPGANGTANVSSVTTRESATWNAASGSGPATVTTSNQQVWSNWAGTNGEIVTDISTWSAGSGGTFGFSGQLNNPVTMDTGDSLTVTSITGSVPTAS